jgi:hypothetical protein
LQVVVVCGPKTPDFSAARAVIGLKVEPGLERIFDQSGHLAAAHPAGEEIGVEGRTGGQGQHKSGLDFQGHGCTGHAREHPLRFLL